MAEKVSVRDDAVRSSCASPKFKAGRTYGLYINGEKKMDITLKDGMNAVGDDGGKFTGGYSRGLRR